MSDTIDIKSLLDKYIKEGGVVIYGNNNTVVFGNHFSGGSSAVAKKAKTNTATQEDDFTVNPRTDVETASTDLNRDSVDANVSTDDKAKAEDIVRKLEAIEDEIESDILFDAGDEGFDVAQKIIEIGLGHFNDLDITVDNIVAVNAVLKEHYDDKK